MTPRSSGSSEEPALESPPLRVLKQREDTPEESVAPSSRAFVSWRARRKRPFKMEEMLW